MDSIPEDIFYNILSQLHASNSSFNNINYRDLYKLRIVNKSFKYYIDNIKNCKLCNNVNSYENIFNRLAYSGLFCNFEWLFNNNFCISINNINNLIIHFRYDILNLLIKYDNLKNILFNRFNLFTYKGELDILSLSKSDNPLIIAGMNFNNKESNLNIINLLLNDSINGNPYIHQIPDLFQIAIKHNNIVIIKYLITNYYSQIKHHCYKLISYMMCSNNNEELFFYVVQSDKIDITSQFLINCIKKSYNELFIYSYNKIIVGNYKNLLFHICEKNNIHLFSFILKNEDNIDFNNIVDQLLNYDNKFKFISLLLNEYFDLIDKNSKFIKLCLKNDIEDSIIIHLINEGFKITIDDMKECINKENIILLEYLSKKYNSI